MPALRLPHDGGQLKLSGTQDWARPLILYLPAVPPTHIYRVILKKSMRNKKEKGTVVES